MAPGSAKERGGSPERWEEGERWGGGAGVPAKGKQTLQAARGYKTALKILIINMHTRKPEIHQWPGILYPRGQRNHT